MTQHVVIVDDDDLNLKLLRGIAAELPDVEVHAFLSSSEALMWFEGRDIDCFVFDYHMPPPDGLEMIRRTRTMERFAHVPIVIVTGEHERKVRYSAFDAGANDFVQRPLDRREFTARLTTLLALRAAQKRATMHIDSLEWSLLDSEERSREHADRLEALWLVANNPALAEEDLIAAMLQQGAAAIRPNQAWRGLIERFDGNHAIVEQATGFDDAAARKLVWVGQRLDANATIAGRLLRGGDGGTNSWDDLATVADMPVRSRALGMRSAIATVFDAGGTTYGLSFGMTEPNVRPFGRQDQTFVQVLAAFFATHFQQRWQAMRIRHQLEHDSLTGLRNRGQFRSLGRAGFRSDAGSSVIVIDLENFHQLNEQHGHLIGDAVLVEVAAALSAAAGDDELVARVGGDSFAVFLPQVASADSVVKRVEHYGTVFDAPIGIGDRDGRETVGASASFGIAVAPRDGLTFDELLFRAEARAGTAAATST